MHSQIQIQTYMCIHLERERATNFVYFDICIILISQPQQQQQKRTQKCLRYLNSTIARTDSEEVQRRTKRGQEVPDIRGSHSNPLPSHLNRIISKLHTYKYIYTSVYKDTYAREYIQVRECV